MLLLFRIIPLGKGVNIVVLCIMCVMLVIIEVIHEPVFWCKHSLFVIVLSIINKIFSQEFNLFTVRHSESLEFKFCGIQFFIQDSGH